ncbi:MAG: glycosyltransferase family 2 protein [Coprobacillus sp.]
MKKISFVIPCYGSENTIESVVNSIFKTMDEAKLTYEIILVNDSSPDHVWDKITEITEQHQGIKAISFSKNFGQHSALMAGYRVAEGDYIVTIDDDGQTPVSEVFTMINKIEEGYDVVYAYYQERKDSSFRKLGSKINNVMSEKLVGKPRNVQFTSYFVMRKFVCEELIKYENPYPYIWGLVARTTSNIANVKINHQEREDGKSGYTLKKLFSLWMNGFTAFSVIPLRLATLLGMGIAFISFIFIIYLVVAKILNPDMAAGYASTMSAILFIGGIIMVLIGMLGEYIGRIYISMNNSPQYVIKEKIVSNDNSQIK